MILITSILIGILNIPALDTNAANPDYSSIFVASYYSTRYPDLKAAGITTDAALLNHFVTSGMKEGRQGSEEFNVYVYMNNYPDLKAAFGNDLPKYYLHYMNAGKAEGRVARGNASAPATTVPTTPTVNSGALNTSPVYPVTNLTDIVGRPRVSRLSYKVGDTIINAKGRAKTVTQADINQWNYNPYGLTSGTSVVTGSASIGEIRYINYSLPEHSTMRQPHSVKMECYAINKNGVPLFREFGSNYNVYTQQKYLIPLIDSVTPTMNEVDIDWQVCQVKGWSQGESNCSAIANAVASYYGQLLIEAYHITSDVYDHEECHIYVGNGRFIRHAAGGKGYTQTVEEMRLTKDTYAGTFYVDFTTQE